MKQQFYAAVGKQLVAWACVYQIFFHVIFKNFFLLFSFSLHLLCFFCTFSIFFFSFSFFFPSPFFSSLPFLPLLFSSTLFLKPSSMPSQAPLGPRAPKLSFGCFTLTTCLEPVWNPYKKKIEWNPTKISDLEVYGTCMEPLSI